MPSIYNHLNQFNGWLDFNWPHCITWAGGTCGFSDLAHRTNGPRDEVQIRLPDRNKKKYRTAVNSGKERQIYVEFHSMNQTLGSEDFCLDSVLSRNTLRNINQFWSDVSIIPVHCIANWSAHLLFYRTFLPWFSTWLSNSPFLNTLLKTHAVYILNLLLSAYFRLPISDGWEKTALEAGADYFDISKAVWWWQPNKGGKRAEISVPFSAFSVLICGEFH